MCKIVCIVSAKATNDGRSSTYTRKLSMVIADNNMFQIMCNKFLTD